MLSAYTTLARAGQSEVVEKRSRFLGVAAPAEDAEQAAQVVQQIRAAHHDARHHCFAYLLKDGSKRYSDDGEPQGTAGLPILDVLERQAITDCVIVVTRYFGGTLLGTGGLVRAYSAAAVQALENAEKLNMSRYAVGTLTCDYGGYGRIPPLIAAHGGMVREPRFAADVTVSFYLPDGAQNAFQKDLSEQTLGAVQAVFSSACFVGESEGGRIVKPADPAP